MRLWRRSRIQHYVFGNLDAVVPFQGELCRAIWNTIAARRRIAVHADSMLAT
ncbi:hypothetical protein [Achromobacter pestifer]